jgi:thioredoxin 1
MERNDQPTNVTTADFERVVLESRMPVLVDFWAQWCPPCHAIAPVIEAFAAEYGGRLSVAKVDIDDNTKLAAEYQVRSIPTVMLFADGAVRGVLVGARSSDAYREAIDALLH